MLHLSCHTFRLPATKTFSFLINIKLDKAVFKDLRRKLHLNMISSFHQKKKKQYNAKDKQISQQFSQSSLTSHSWLYFYISIDNIEIVLLYHTNIYLLIFFFTELSNVIETMIFEIQNKEYRREISNILEFVEHQK